MFASASKINLKTLRYNFLTFSLRDFMQDLFTQGYPPPPPLISNKRSRAK
ncbi:type III restriction endonuclease subunit R [Helicobacter pylori]|nr:type III restriction endonuclease subunit R [Helicobacter pylori]AHN43950.1 type III restriction endonuclease subunit R [Helicobacter pylori oki828]